ncbi:alpha-ketoglutarate-dependent dioxygenase AlkB family protein [Thalassolituus sp. LLYu03]|uniref:alpha-ketoglutarate-dependent dioxygenase AlkB family protein n=1 Tax=Thalassolituus sp. LLYu03 TaxID=3421656 RepID=UPI003D2AAEDC
MTSNTSLLRSGLAGADVQDVLGNGLLAYTAQAIQAPDTLFRTLLHDIAWEAGFVTLYGKRHQVPRLQAWYGDEGIRYTYSGETLTTRVWTPVLAQLRDELSAQFGLPLNSVLCNLYRSGQDSMGWHSDDEPELGVRPRILSLSLGAVRDFALRPKGSGRQHTVLALANGSLLDMRPGLQDNWQHALPKRMKTALPRINLTFRFIV